ncbi:MAG: AarF/UbiB family protein [Pseudomonadales bacterium]
MMPPEHVPAWFRWLGWPLKLIPAPSSNPGADLASALVKLGPAFIKVGQLLSTRRDLLPHDVIEALSTLQDQVPPFDHALAMRHIEQALSEPLDQIFEHIEQAPLASASIAQVYGARLRTGEAVVLKILRPGIRAAVERDLARLETLSRWLTEHWDGAHRLRLDRVLKDYREVILGELSLTREASNAQRLRDLWLPRGKLYVPKIYAEYSSENLLVMERVYGTVVTDLSTLEAQQVDLARLSQLGVEIFFTQVFEDNFFHADMHPGNILVDHSDPTQPTYIALDCAIIGQLSREDRNYLASNLIAFFSEDYGAVATLHIESGWVPPETSHAEMEAVIRETCAPLFGKPMAEIEFGKLLVSLFQAAQRFDMSIQPQLVLLQKTLLNIEGIGRQLYGQLDLWETAAPFLDQWMARRRDPWQHLERLKTLLPIALAEGPELPEHLVKAPRRIEQILKNNRQLEQRVLALSLQLKQQDHSRRRSELSWLLLLIAVICFLPILINQPLTLEWPRTALGCLTFIGGLAIRGTFLR